MVMDDVSSYLEEMAYWMDLGKAPKKEYRDYLSV
jgi:hypothetical protein